MPTSNKLNYLLETKNLIKRAIEKLTKKTIPENTTFREYSELFNDITVVDNQEKVITINSNGTTEITPDADKTGLDKVTVTTAIPLEDNKSQTITGNGTITITPTAGNTAMKKVTVTTNVNTVKNQNKTQSITANGTVTVKPDSGYTGLGQVTINTNVQKALTAAGKNVMSAPASSLATSITAPPGISMLILTCAANRAEANSTPSVSGTNITLQSRTAISTSRANIYSNEIVIEKTWACKIQNTSSSNKAVNISWANSGAIMLTASLVAQ